MSDNRGRSYVVEKLVLLGPEEADKTRVYVARIALNDKIGLSVQADRKKALLAATAVAEGKLRDTRG